MTNLMVCEITTLLSVMTILLSIISIIFSLGILIYNIIEYKKVKKEYEEVVLKKRGK